MKGKEFVKKILKGERDFSRIELETGFDLVGYEGFAEMQRIIRNEREFDPAAHQQSSLILDSSKLVNLKADGIYLPNARGDKADFRGSSFKKACLEYGEFFKGNFRQTNLEEANLQNASLRCAQFYGACLTAANVSGTNFEMANFEVADIRGIRNLEHAEYIEWASFNSTKVTRTERKILEKRLLKNFDHLFDSRN